jgi:hypothetical protein
MELNGVPLHPLVIHAVVVFAPMAALAAIAMSIPKYRWIARWPALLLTLAATAATFVATRSGVDLMESREGLSESPLVQTHQEWGGRLMIAMWIFAALVIVAFWVLPHVTRLKDAEDRVGKVAALEKPLMVVVPLAAVAVLALAVITGDAGAQAVWQR